MTSYAYIHCKPDGTPFYVGKGVRSRYRNFNDRNVYHKRVVSKYGKENILIGKIDCSTNQFALDLEVGIIKCLKRMGFSLANFTSGGEGTVGWKQPESVKAAVAQSNKRRVWTEESRKKAGASQRGKKRPDHSAWMKANCKMRGENNPLYGKGYLQAGEKNPNARPVFGINKTGEEKNWVTLKEAADELGVTIQAVFQAIKKDQRSKGWKLRYM